MFLPNYQNRTPVNFISLHFVVAFIFLLLSACLLFTISENFRGHYFQPHILAITHLASLGWITTVIFGVSYQIIPVLADKPLFSIKLAALTLFLQVCGSAVLGFSFWYFRLDLLAMIGGACVLLSFLTYTLNIYLTWGPDQAHERAKDFIFVSLGWLVITAVFGLVLLLNLRFAFLTVSHLEMLKLHAHFGFVGWFILLIMGVAAKLLPMFMLSEGYNKNLLRLSFYSINAGLLILIMLVISNSRTWLLLPGAIIALGIVLYLAFVYQVIKFRIRKALDEGLKKSRLAFVLLSIPLSCGLIISADTLPRTERTAGSFSVFYGFSYLFGFITLLVMAQTFKTLPFLIWSKHHATGNSPAVQVMPKDLYSEKLLKGQFVFFMLSYFLFSLGFLCGNAILFKIAGLLFITSVLLYGTNLFKLILSNGRKG